MDLNVKSVFYAAQKFAPLLQKRASIQNPSRIIVTASVAGLGVGTLGQNATFAYSASKAAVIHLAKNLAVELGPRGILTNSIAPGFYPTKMASGLMELQGGSKPWRPRSPTSDWVSQRISLVWSSSCVVGLRAISMEPSSRLTVVPCFPEGSCKRNVF